MKIRTKLTLRYCGVTALLLILVFFMLEEALFPQDGYDMFHILTFKLMAIWLLTIVILFVIGYFMARSVLRPVSRIVDEVESISVSNLRKRLAVNNARDEIGELTVTFNHMLDRLEESFESQKMFVSNVSHELRTPMAALITELELSMNKERSNDDYKKVLTNVLGDARKMEKLTGGLLDLAKASYNAEQISMSPVRLDEVLIDASSMVMKANQGFVVDLVFGEEDDEEQNVTVVGNEYLLRTAFVNLMENNCKFSADRTASVQISFDGSKARICFSDNGIGIPNEDLPHLFKPFFRGQNKHYSQGNGIGMALVNRILLLHQGHISIASHLGEGTCFEVLLPHL
ncbi:MAG: HAMP domain-containing sensor histidine kinase [Breznakibacter sp.]